MDVYWSPMQNDQFMLSGTMLNLFRINTKMDEGNNPIVDYKEKFTYLSSGIEVPRKQCVAWRPDSNPDNLIAIGLSNGKVLLTSFSKSGAVDPDNLIGKELGLLHPRSCNYLEWNPKETYLLAEVTERQKSDCCILIWDVRYPSPAPSFPKPLPLLPLTTDRRLASPALPADQPSYFSMSTADPNCRPIVELGASESCSSFNWFHDMPRTFICGMNMKILRVFDIRAQAESIKPHMSTSTKAVNSLSVDRSFEKRVVSCFENVIHIWDLRRFTDPVETIIENKAISKVAWCPTKAALLAASFVDMDIVKFYDFKQVSELNDYSDRMRMEKTIQPTVGMNPPLIPSSVNDDVISSFDWHPKNKPRLICCTPSGRIADLHPLNARPVLWSPDLRLSVAYESLIHTSPFSKLSREAGTDISVKIRKRAMKGYGVKSNIIDNVELVTDDETLKRVWTWVHLMKSDPGFHQPPQPMQLQATPTLPRTISYTKITPDPHYHHPTQPPQHPGTPFPQHLPTSPTAPHHLNRQGHSQALTPSQQQQLSQQHSLYLIVHPLYGVRSLFPPKGANPLKQYVDTVSLEWLMTTTTIAGEMLMVSSGSGAYPGGILGANLGKAGGGQEGGLNPRYSCQVFKSPLRTRAIEMCGWRWGHDTPSLPIIDQLAAEQQYTRSAAISVFTLRMMRALEVLSEGVDVKGANYLGPDQNCRGVDLAMVAMSLSAYPGNPVGAWGTQLAQLIRGIKDAYLKSIFQFLTCKDTDYDELLDEPQLELSDRIAFACLHLSDKRLMAFLEKQTTIFINNGDLTGLILTGLTENGVQLLSKFIDKTSDIQTAVTLILQGLPEVDITKLSLVEHWFENYRSLLNSMKLWNERAEFDVFQRKQEKSIMESLRQVHICCTFCSKPIITDQKTNRIRANIKPRVQSCPHCRKPLPRCAICMLHMGTASGISCPKSTKSNLKQGKTLARISEWFTWCQNCLHGGHADHIINWFSTHSRCPVSGCNCKCERLDSVSRVDTYTNIDDDDDGCGGGDNSNKRR